MNAGQMMMQTPVNATLPVAIPASPAMVSVPAEDQLASDFAGVLAGMTPKGSSKSVEVIGTTKPADRGAPAVTGISPIPMQQYMNVAVMAALQAITAKVAPTELSYAGVSQGQTEPVEEKASEDVEMPQNVVLCASGALVAAEQHINGGMQEQSQHINGRIPEQSLTVTSQEDGRAKVTSMDALDTLKSAFVPENILPQAIAVQMAAVPAEAMLKVAEASLFGIKEVVTVPETVNSTKNTLQQPVVERKAEAPVETTLVTTTVQLERTVSETGPINRSVAAEQVVRLEVVPEQITKKNEVNSAIQPKPVQFIDSAAMKAEVLRASDSQEQPGIGTGDTAVVSAENEVKEIDADPRQKATNPVHTLSSRAQVVAAPADQIAAPTANQAVPIVEVHTPEDFQVGVVQQRVTFKKENSVVPNLQSSATTQPNSKTEDRAALAVPSAKEQVAVHPADFRFSRSASVEAALGGSQQVSVRTPDKNVSEIESGMKMAIVQQQTEKTDAGFSGSNADSSERNFEGLFQQTPQLARPAVQTLPGIHQPFSIDTSVTTPLQALQPETSRPGSSEHVAGQVRDQLGTHEIKTGSEQITIRLSPEHLGDIKVNFRLEDKILKVEIVTENRFAKESLMQHADSLKESLVRQNISMDKFEVTTGGSSSGHQGNNTQGDWRELAKNRQLQQWLTSGGYRTPSADVVQKTPVYFAGAENAGLDLHF